MNGTKVILPGPLTQYRTFLVDDLAVTIHELHLRESFGGQTALNFQKRIGVDPLKRRRVVVDEADHVETSVSLGRASGHFITGFRRIGVRAAARVDDTEVEIFETKKMGWIIVSLALLSCLFLVPAVIGVVANMMNSSYNRKVIWQAAAAIKVRYPGAVVSGTGGGV